MTLEVLNKPWFSPEQSVGLLDFWRVYDANYDKISRARQDTALEDPTLGPILKEMPDEAAKWAGEDSKEQLRRAIFEDQWGPYRSMLRTDGETYAKMGVPYSSWVKLMRSSLRVLSPLLMKALYSDPKRLEEAMLISQELLYQATTITAEGYWETKDTLRRQSELDASSHAEEALRKSEQTLMATLDSIHEGISIVDPKGQIAYENNMAQEITGLLLKAQPQEGWSSIPHVLYPDGTPCPPEDLPVARALRGERVRDLELFFVSSALPDGGLYLNINAGPIIDTGGEFLGTLATFRDVSHRRKLEEAQAEGRRIQEASRLKSEFLANMSHELRTPLNSIIGFAELLHDGEVGAIAPKQKEFLGDILTSGRHLLQLINDILDLSKVEAGKIEFQPETLELSEIIGEVTSVLRAVAASKQIQIDVSIDPELKEIMLDPGRLKQVLYNYLSNALKFTPREGWVEVRVRAEGSEFFRLEVEDNGIGISERDLGRLFVEFQQLDAGTAKKHGGTGLGLALTKRIVEAQGGSIGAESVLHQGSTFFAILPRRGEQKVIPLR